LVLLVVVYGRPQLAGLGRFNLYRHALNWRKVGNIRRFDVLYRAFVLCRSVRFFSGWWLI
jgi:hypothetical protein